MKLLVLLIIVLLGFTTVYAQENASQKLIDKIDSITKAKGIENGIVSMHRLTSNATGTYTETYNIQKTPQKFFFDGQFLVMNKGYYNIDKLLYFFIRENYIDFYFQEY
jgi:hypothetical protein